MESRDVGGQAGLRLARLRALRAAAEERKRGRPQRERCERGEHAWRICLLTGDLSCRCGASEQSRVE